MEIPFALLAPETLQRLLEEFVTRDGTDNGDLGHPLEGRVSAVRLQLERGEAVIGFDPETESCSVAAARPARPGPCRGGHSASACTDTCTGPGARRTRK